jgi:hypothetical protein
MPGATGIQPCSGSHSHVVTSLLLIGSTQDHKGPTATMLWPPYRVLQPLLGPASLGCQTDGNGNVTCPRFRKRERLIKRKSASHLQIFIFFRGSWFRVISHHTFFGTHQLATRYTARICITVPWLSPYVAVHKINLLRFSGLVV